MKKFGKIIAIASALLFATSIYFSCSNSADEPKKEDQTGGDNSGGNNGGTTDDKNGDDNPDENGTSKPISSTGAITESGIDFSKLGIKVKASTATFPQDFVRGFDASTVYAIENAGMKYLDADGNENDIFKVLKASGVNMIRLRIWNDPSKDDESSKQGGNNLEVTKALAKRATEAGMKYMLDFHFSDTWADPSHQKCPDSWKGITTADEMKTKIADFVESTLNVLKESSGLPAMVQLGNECEGGILLSNTANTSVQAKAGSENFKAYINAAAEKVRAADETIKIVMHASRGGNANVVNNFITNTSGIDYDYIGLSYYPFFTSHGTLENLKTNIKAIKAAGKKAIISETSFCWTCDWVEGKCDKINNQHWYYSGTNNAEGLVQAAKSLVDSSGKLVMGLTTMTKDDKTVIAPTVQNQYNAVAAVMEASAEAGADGVIYWGGDWITNSAGSVPSAMENQAFWDYDHKILDSAAVFSYGTQKSNTAADNTSGDGTLVKEVSLSSITTTLPGVTVLEGTKFSALSESNTITVIITCNSWETTDNEKTWYCYTIDGATWKANIDTWGDKSVSTTITGADITTLKSGSLTIYGNNADATVTVSYE